MTTWTYAQLEGLWINAGGSTATAPLAAAIAEAESSGNDQSTSANPDGGTNVGLWQLDTPGGKGAGYTVAQLKDPATNAKVAVAGSSKGADWSAWATFASGAYKKFISSGTTPDTSTPAASTTAATSKSDAGCLIMIPNLDPVSAVPIIGSLAPSTAQCILSKSQARAIMGGALLLGGGTLVLMGLLVLATTAFARSGAGRATAQVAESVVPAGRVAKAVGAAAASRTPRDESRREQIPGPRQLQYKNVGTP